MLREHGDCLARDPSTNRHGIRKNSIQIKRNKLDSVSSYGSAFQSLSPDSLSLPRNHKSSSSRRPSQYTHSPTSTILLPRTPRTPRIHEWSSPNQLIHETKPSLQTRRKKISLDLQKLALESEMSEEEVEEKQLEEESCSNGRLRSILKSKLGFGVAKNRQTAAMNAILILRPKHSERRDEEIFKLAFRWMKTLIHRVWILYRFSQLMKVHSSSLLEKSARMEAEDVLRTVEQRSALSNRSSSRTGQERTNEISRLLARPRSLLPPRYRQILNKYPHMRTDGDISEMRVFLRSSIREFKQYSEKTQLALCRSMYYTFYEKGRIILRQGNQGKNFYIALSGSLILMRYDVDTDTGEGYTCDYLIKSGEKFGDIALQRKTRRTATIVCCEDSELLMIDKDLFDRHCPNLSEEQLKEKMTAVSDVSLFEGWQSGDLEELLLEARMRDYTINRVVVRDSLDSAFLFVVVGGKCRVLKEIDVKKMGWSHGLKGHTNARHFHLSELAPSKYSQTATCNNTNSLSKQHNDSIPQMNDLITRDGKAYVQLRELGPGDIFELTEMYRTYLSKMGIRANKNKFLKPQSLMLVSDGAKLLQITKSKFKSKAGPSFMETLPKYFIKYPREEELIRNYKVHVSWILYRKDILSKELANQKAQGKNRAQQTKGVIWEQLIA